MSNKLIPCETCITLAICLGKVIDGIAVENDMWVFISQDMNCTLLDDYTCKYNLETLDEEFYQNIDNVADFFINKSDYLKTRITEIEKQENRIRWKQVIDDQIKKFHVKIV